VIHHFSTLDSTNTVAAEMAARGAAHGTVIHAERQTGGRGRADREFVSPEGGLYFSLILTPGLQSVDLPLITLAAGVGLCHTLKAVAMVDVQLKWPNDLYLGERKLGGILTESGPYRAKSGPEYVVIGVGINVTTEPASFPSPLRSRVISLYHGRKCHVEIISLLQPLVDGIMSAVRRLAENRRLLLADWQALDYLQGRELEYDSDAGRGFATGCGLAPDGRYIVRDQAGTEHHILAGDINPVRLIYT
jgi:BirA family biotin operon repressor/biotin-[acetyl-CoA-carboxylase] ligase